MVDVLIVGAGPTGLTAAIELARRGLSCRIIDRAVQPSEESRAFGIHSRTLEVMESLGVLPALLSRGIQQRGLNLYEGGKRRLHLDLTNLDAPHRYMLGIPQSHLEQCLRDHLAGLGVKVEFATELRAFSQTDERVEAEVLGPGTVESVSASWILGCDGARSTVRKTLGLSFEGTSYQNLFLLLDVDIQWNMARDESHIFSSDAGSLVVVPMPDGWRIIVDSSLDDHGGEPLRPTFELFERIARERGPDDLSLGDPKWMAAFRIHKRIAESYRRGRAFLMGDACHVQSPIGAQGLNTGVQDAHNLAWKLALVHRGSARRDLLDSYEAERMPIAREMLKRTDALTSFAFSRIPFVSAIQRLALGTLASLPAVQRRIVLQASQIGQNYRGSPIVSALDTAMPTSHKSRSAYGSPPRPGDRAPDAPLQRADSGEPTRLFSVMNSGSHSLLVLLGPDSDPPYPERWCALSSAVSDRFGAAIDICFIVRPDSSLSVSALPFPAYLDTEGAVHGRYCERPGVYVVRPDGYVAYRSASAEILPLVSFLDVVLKARSDAQAPPVPASA